MINRQLRAEIETLLTIGPTGRQLAANWKVSPPSSAAFLHPDLELSVEILSKELLAQMPQPLLEVITHSVPDNIEEARLAAGARNLDAHVLAIRGSSYQRLDVYHRNFGEVASHVALEKAAVGLGRSSAAMRSAG
jgi:hypothetical protein